jgi:tRNA threonylcarbamoyladenosine biosynthesis protein TsaE
VRDVPGPQTVKHLTRSAEETEELGRRIAAFLRPPAVILLRGSLGAGKTTLTRGLAQGLGVPDASVVSSPSFTLVNIYQGRCPVYHVDLYRLEGCRDIYSTGLEEFLGSRGVTIVEWSERLEFPVPAAIIVEISDAGGDLRKIEVRRPASVRGPHARSSQGTGRRRSR